MNRRTLLPLVLTTLLGVEPRQDVVAAPASSPVVGAWRVVVRGAPVAHHFLVFSADGTILSIQSPGATGTSVSDGAGAYHLTRDMVEGAFEELDYDNNGTYRGRIRVEFRVQVHGEEIRGDAVTRVFDARDKIVVTTSPYLTGSRISSTVHFPH